MSERRGPSPETQRNFQLALLAAVTLLFSWMIRNFLLSVLLGAIIAGLTTPLQRRLELRLGGRPHLAAAVTVLLVLFGVGVPILGFLSIVAAEAIQLGQGAEGFLEAQRPRVSLVLEWLTRIPLIAAIVPAPEEMAGFLQDASGRIGGALLGTLAAAGRGTAGFFLQSFIVLYALFVFLLDGVKILDRLRRFLPLTPAEFDQLLGRFRSVASATLKGSVLIGFLQGGLAGLAFWIAGVPGPAFWGMIMIVLSVIPAVGAALVWVPAVVYLFLAGELLSGTLLLIWCAIVVSSLDNLLRPRLIGREAGMPDLMILLSTLGGIVLFGAIGFLIGPIIGAVFLTVWDLFGERWMGRSPDPGEPLAP